MEEVLDRSKSTLLPLIVQNIAPESHVVSDGWSANLGISSFPVDPAYTHGTFNHDKYFKDPVTGAHTNNLECFGKTVRQR